MNMRYLGHATTTTMYLSPGRPDFKFSPGWLPLIRSAFNSLGQLEPKDPVLRPFKHFHLLKHLPADSDAHVLGLFSVIEMILTHKPSDKLHDSLRHQVSTKMDLLSKRFLKTDVYEMFQSQNRADIWKTLYDWRSSIAHGDESDFSKGSLKKLETKEKAHAFLDMNVRLLLKTWLEERDLVSDLKRC